MDDKIVHPNIEDSRVLTYLGIRDKTPYKNTAEEDQLVQLWNSKYELAKSEYEKSRANSDNLKVWRDAFEGKFQILDEDGKPNGEYQKAIRKLAFELVEGKVNSHIPAPKMTPRYYFDIPPINATESVIRQEMDRMLSEEVNDEAEHAVLIDSMVWFKVSWNPFDNTHERSGMPVVEACPIDTVFPQPGIKNYKRLEYIFEKSTLTLAEVLDLYGREVSPSEDDLVHIVTVYYLNKDRYVGKFMWVEDDLTVICNDLEWGIRRRRECVDCRHISPIDDTCPICGSKKFKYFPVKSERLKKPLVWVTNPYRADNNPDPSKDQNQLEQTKQLPEGTEIPHYLLRQLPFVPYRRINVPNSIYGISEVETILEDQDFINKLLNKAERKSKSSKAWVTKLKDTNIDNGDEISYVEVESPAEGQAIQVKQIVADISEEMAMANTVYDIAKSTSGVTNTDQGKEDPTARSGKAKQLQMAASAQRNTGPSVLRNLAYAGVYELIFKNMLAFSDEERSFVNTLPDGTQKEEIWSKYMFLNQDDNGDFYYRDDFAWSVDTATEITQDRASMWQLIDNDFINGTLGTQVDPTRALLMYWQMKDQAGYPLAKFALAFLKESVHHLPTQVEQALLNNPAALEMALSYVSDMQNAQGLAGGAGTGNRSTNTGNQGGARNNAGRKGNGATHSANVEKTNNKNRTQSGASATNTNAMATGGMQGGTNLGSMIGGEG